MKQLSILVITVLSLVLFSCKENVQKDKQVNNEKLTNKIEVIDFYSTHRCMTCEAIEANTKYTLELYYPEELKSKKITFQTINVDEEANYKTAEKFESTGTALFLNVVIDGKETPIDLTEFAFMDGNNQEDFSNKLKAKIDVELAKL